MRHIKRYIDRLGRERLYFRATGHPRNGEALRSPWPDVEEGSALQAEVAAILGTQLVKPRPGNLAAAARAYELSADFTGLAAETQYGYRRMMIEFEDDLGALSISAFTPGFIQQLRDAWAARGHRAANMRLQLLKNILTPQLIAADAADPFSRIRQVRRPREAVEPHPVWPETVVRAVIEAAIQRQRHGVARAVALGRYAGARRGDLVRIKRSARTVVPGSNSAMAIAWLSGKKRVPVSMPEDPLLTDWLAVTEPSQPLSRWQAHVQRRSGVVQMPPATIVFNTRNRAYTEDGLHQELAKIVRALHAEGRIDGAHYNLHGLRHTFGVEAAIAGCTDAQGAALMGHGSPHSFATYRKQADRITLAADGAALIAALRERPSRTSAEQALSNEGLTASNRAGPVVPMRGRKH